MNEPNSPPPQPALAAKQARSRRAAHPNLPFFARAAQPEIVRANQKDEYYLAQITERFEDVLRILMGTRWIHRWSNELQQGSRLAYFGLTTLLGTQTLGEEYCDILQSSNRKQPSKSRRAFLIAAHIVTPYLLSNVYSGLRARLIAYHQAHLDSQDAFNDLFGDGHHQPPPKPKTSFRCWLASFGESLPTFDTLTEDWLRSVHLAVFYLVGRYYHLSKRITGIRYISLQPKRSTEGRAPASSYSVLGFLMVIQIVVRLIIAIRARRAAKRLKEYHESSAMLEVAVGEANQATSDLINEANFYEGENQESRNERMEKRGFLIDGKRVGELMFDPEDPDQASPYSNEEETESNKCMLCLGVRRDPSATECGHVFCWECIVGWAREKPECPLCRQAVQVSKILPLNNI